MSVSGPTVESNMRDLIAASRPAPNLHRSPLELRALKSGIRLRRPGIPILSMVMALAIDPGDVPSADSNPVHRFRQVRTPSLLLYE